MNFEDIKKLVNSLASDFKKQNTTNNSFKRTVSAKNLKGIIDISFDEQARIPKIDFDEKPLIKDYRYWILKLDRYYKNPAMRIGQMNVASLKLYAKLCDSLEAELNKDGTSVARMVSKLRRETANYDLYYTLYRIAETTVINFYNPLSTKTYEKSLKILENNTSKKIRETIELEAIKLSKDLEAPSKETREFFSLTDNNKVSLWWDPDGRLRDKYAYRQDEELAINQISKRSNVLWRNNKVKYLLMDMYLATAKAIFDSPDLDSKNILQTIRPYNFSKATLDNLLLVSEARLREEFSFYNKISTEKAIKQLSDIQCGHLLAFVKDFQDAFINDISPNTINEIYLDYFRENPGKTRDMVAFLRSFESHKQIAILDRYQKHESFLKVCEELSKKQDSNLQMMGLYYIYKLGENQQRHENTLFKLILEENYDDFKYLVEANELSLLLLERLKGLKDKKPKRIKVDNKKISASRKELVDTVETLNKFFEEEDEGVVEAEANHEVVISQAGLEYRDILEEILTYGYIELGDLDRLAKEAGQTTNSFIGKINESLYDYIGDQTLILDGDRLIIDEFYVDMLKEYVNGN